MIEINFKFREKDNIIKCDIYNDFIDICKEFAKSQALNLEDLI